MTALREVARAKLNLTLEVLGRRPDGFHEIQSLVAFAGVSDNVELTSGNRLELAVDGPFAVALGGDNLITRAAEAAKAANQKLRIRVLGLARIAADVSPELALATIESITVLGALQASREVKAALSQRIH